MKKFIFGVIIGVMLTSTISFAVSYVAEPAPFKVVVNGKEFTSDPPAMVINDRTYLPLRAIGDALGVPVEWNEELRQAEVGTITNKETTSKGNENTSGYITYKEKPWCPDFGVWIGKTPYVDFVDDEDNSYCCVYKSSGVTMSDIKEYMRIFHTMGYEVGTVTNGYACKDKNGNIVMGIKVDDDQIFVVVY